jgi:hypothetical protein
VVERAAADKFRAEGGSGSGDGVGAGDRKGGAKKRQAKEREKGQRGTKRAGGAGAVVERKRKRSDSALAAAGGEEQLKRAGQGFGAQAKVPPAFVPRTCPTHLSHCLQTSTVATTTHPLWTVACAGAGC